MGYAISWLAVKGIEPEVVHRQLGLFSSGEFDTDLKHPFMGRMLPTGWYVVVAQRCDDIMILDDMLASLSANSSVIAASIEEHVMFCFSTCWSNGVEAWRVQH